MVLTVIAAFLALLLFGVLMMALLCAIDRETPEEQIQAIQKNREEREERKAKRRKKRRRRRSNWPR